jgi:hypothetical protein
LLDAGLQEGRDCEHFTLTFTLETLLISRQPSSDPVNDSQPTLGQSISGLITALTSFMDSLPGDSTPVVDFASAFPEPDSEIQPGIASSAFGEVDPAVGAL